jgi:hypothetical protein
MTWDFMQRMVNLGNISIPKEEICCSMAAFSAGNPHPKLIRARKDLNGKKNRRQGYGYTLW